MFFDFAFLLPIAAAGAAVAVALWLKANRIQYCLVAGLAAVLVGAATTFHLTEIIIDVGAHVTYEMFRDAWRRAWYPLATGVIVAIVLAVFALWPRRHPETSAA